MATALMTMPEEIFAARLDPLLRTEITDSSGSLQGWVVVDSLVNGTAMGGTRMTESVCVEEVEALARAMTTKLALADLPIGGAKAGLRPVPGQRDAVLRNFGRAVSPLLHGGIYLGCDQGTTHADRDLFFAEAGYDVLRLPSGAALPTDWATFWSHLVDITGFGVATSVLVGLDGLRLKNSSAVVIQGFGTVGRAVASTLVAEGHRVVGVADVLGTVADPAGLPVEKLIAATDRSGTIDRTALPESVQAFPAGDAWIDVRADVLVLAAGGDAVTADNVDRVTARLVVEGGNLCCAPEARSMLRSRSVILMPDVVANVGGAGVTGSVLTGLAPTHLPMPALAHWLFDWVKETVRANSRAVLDIAASTPAADPVPALLLAHRNAQ